MKIIKYEKQGQSVDVAMLFDDMTFGSVSVVDRQRPREEILKDVYILLKNSVREVFSDDTKDLEDWSLEPSKPTSFDVDFYGFNGKVYDQYGTLLDEPITFEIQGTDKAKIEDGKLITEEVQEETSFFIVARCKDLEKRQERKLYKRPDEPKPKKDVTETLVKEVANLKIDSIKDKQINKRLGQEVANLKIKLMAMERSKN